MTNHKAEMAIELRRAARALTQQEEALKELAFQLDSASPEDFHTVHALGLTAVTSISRFSTSFIKHGDSVLTHVEAHVQKHTTQ